MILELLHEANIENPNPCSQGRIQKLLRGRGLKSFFFFRGVGDLAVGTRLGKKNENHRFYWTKGGGLSPPSEYASACTNKEGRANLAHPCTSVSFSSRDLWTAHVSSLSSPYPQLRLAQFDSLTFPAFPVIVNVISSIS